MMMMYNMLVFNSLAITLWVGAMSTGDGCIATGQETMRNAVGMILSKTDSLLVQGVM